MKKVLFLLVLLPIFIFSSTLIRNNHDLKNRIIIEDSKDYTAASSSTGINRVFSDPVHGTHTLVGHSINGYGLVSSNTRPISFSEELGLFVVYRKWYEEYEDLDMPGGPSSGRLGSAYSDDGEDWSHNEDLFNFAESFPWGASARYPSALFKYNDDDPVSTLPHIFWNEYSSSNLSSYGGRPFYSYDEFGFEGGSFTWPADVLFDYEDNSHDFWVGSPAMSTDEGTTFVNVVYDDWSNGYSYMVHSLYPDEQGMMGEPFMMDPEVIFPWGNDGLEETGFSSSPILSINNDGDGIVSSVGLFTDGTASFHTPIFKLTNNHGQNWDDEYHFVPDDVFNDIYWNQIYPATEDGYWNHYCWEYEDGNQVGDPVLLESYFVSGQWTWYNADVRMSDNGNIHMLIQITPSINYNGYDNFVMYGLDNAIGYYHLTINKDYASNPGEVNTPTGWNWSFVMDADDGWGWQPTNNGGSGWDSHGSLSFAQNNPDVVWAVFNTPHAGELRDDPDVEYRWFDCDGGIWNRSLEDYTSWSYDILVAKSVDGGHSWSETINVTQTEGDFSNGQYDGPEETYVHAPRYSTEDNVYFMYQMPEWSINFIGDLYIPAYLQDVYVGFAGEDLDFFPSSVCASECGEENLIQGDVNGDDNIDIMDAVTAVAYILDSNYPGDCSFCMSDLDESGSVNILDVIILIDLILGTPRHADATSAIMDINTDGVSITSDGYIGAIQMTLSHDDNFTLSLTDDAFVSDYRTDGNTTTLIVVVPEDDIVFTTSDTFKVDEVLVANSQSFIEVTEFITEFGLSTAYPNPFNPTTTVEFSASHAGYASVKAYNLMGQLVGVLLDGMVDANVYTLTWDAQHLPSGVYMIKAENNGQFATQKIMLLK